MTKEELIEMAEKVYGKCDWHGDALAHLEQLAKLVAEREREACANTAGLALLGADKALSDRVLKAIRARGQE